MSQTMERPRAAAAPSGIAGAAAILSPDALDFLAELHERFDDRRRALLDARDARQILFDAGELPDFIEETRHIR
ncbi:MAG TPA: hypothetical protein VGB39_04480, partial [Sphingomicrobium sp.]